MMIFSLIWRFCIFFGTNIKEMIPCPSDSFEFMDIVITLVFLVVDCDCHLFEEYKRQSLGEILILFA